MNNSFDKNALLLISFILAAIMFLGCVVQPDIASIDAEETYPQTPGSLLIVFTHLDEIIDYAEYIAEVEIIGSGVIMLDGFPQTHSAASVLTAIKGDIESGDVIEVVEEGGMTDQGEAVAGVPVMQPGQKYILFLQRTGDSYYIAGAYQGKFIERSGNVFQQATSDVKLADYKPLPVEEFMNVIAGG